MVTFDRLRVSFYRSLEFIEQRGLSTYDPYDIKSLKLIAWALESNSILRLVLRYGLYSVFFMAPLQTRRLLRIQPRITAEGVAFLAEVYREYYEFFGHHEAKRRALFLLSWLMDHVETSKYGIGWGVPYRWIRGSLGAVPPNAPNAHTTAVCVDVLLNFISCGWGKAGIDNVVRGAMRFLANELFFFENEEGLGCFSYTSFDQIRTCVVNTNADMALVFFRASLLFHDKREIYHELGEKLLWFVISEQGEDGSWAYFSKFSNMPTIIDGYHTAMILRSLAQIYALSRENLSLNGGLVAALTKTLRKGVSFYVTSLVTKDGRPKFTPHRVYPVDILSCALGLIALSDICEVNEGMCKELKIKMVIERILNYSLSRMQRKSGEFYYRDYGIKRMRLGSLRWAQAPMSLALLKVLHVLEGYEE